MLRPTTNNRVLHFVQTVHPSLRNNLQFEIKDWNQRKYPVIPSSLLEPRPLVVSFPLSPILLLVSQRPLSKQWDPYLGNLLRLSLGMTYFLFCNPTGTPFAILSELHGGPIFSSLSLCFFLGPPFVTNFPFFLTQWDVTPLQWVFGLLRHPLSLS